MSAYCEVALPVPLDHTFTYAVREGQRPLRGARVIAPFRNEKLIGVVTGLNAKAPPDAGVTTWPLLGCGAGVLPCCADCASATDARTRRTGRIFAFIVTFLSRLETGTGRQFPSAIYWSSLWRRT